MRYKVLIWLSIAKYISVVVNITSQIFNWIENPFNKKTYESYKFPTPESKIPILKPVGSYWVENKTYK